MSPDIYLEKLQELKSFLKQYPEKRKVYNDIPLDYFILKAKQKLYCKEEPDHVQNRLFPDGFEKTDFSPFL